MSAQRASSARQYDTRARWDGRIDFDSNIAERSIWHLALNWKNALFVGSKKIRRELGGHRHAHRELKISGINHHTWLTETLGNLVGGQPANAVGELMPWTAGA